ncbi:MAG: hypothetical protein QOF76_5616 [Solirubrobacteraceae bacterium]|nr:hypothetical protein [Solirubrobacteraceae bacterium]
MPPPIEPVLSAADEVALLTGRDQKSDPTLRARWARVSTLIRRPETPTGRDAELLALLADAKALPVGSREDWLSARQRLHGIGAMNDPPPAVAKVAKAHRVKPGDADAFAEALLKGHRDVGSLDPGISAVVTGGSPGS